MTEEQHEMKKQAELYKQLVEQKPAPDQAVSSGMLFKYKVLLSVIT